MILWEQSFFCLYMLLTATSIFGLGRKRWSFHQQCNLPWLHAMWRVNIRV